MIGWGGSGGCEPRIEDIIKLKESRGRGGVGSSRGSGRDWGRYGIRRM